MISCTVSSSCCHQTESARLWSSVCERKSYNPKITSQEVGPKYEIIMSKRMPNVSSVDFDTASGGGLWE